MLVNIITNMNGVGLQRDAEMLRPVLEQLGHQVSFVQFNNPITVKHADANIFMEVVVPGLFRFAPRQFLFVNPEWYAKEWNQYLVHYEKVFCKTEDAYRIFSGIAGAAKCVRVGFFARDLLDPKVERFREFVHLVGKSQNKNTEAVIACWKTYSLPWKLTVISETYDQSIGHVHFYRRLEDAAIAPIMNHAWFHLMPSRYEGFGHSLHESMGCGAVVLTTARPPMSEVVGLQKELMIQPISAQPHHYGLMHTVGPEQVRVAVEKAMALSDLELWRIGLEARRAFELERPNFVEAFSAVFK